MEQWSQKWKLTFHPKKCHVLTLGKFYNITLTEKYTLHRQELQHVFKQKDIGVILDAKLKFDEHISVKMKKANAIAGLVRRTFWYFDSSLFKKLFTTFVRPHLEYGQVIWTPPLKKYITILENVQRRATKFLYGFHHMSNSERLKKLDLPSLVYRRAWGDMIEIFKHFHSYENCTLPENFRPRKRPSRKHDDQLLWKAPKDGASGLQANFFYFRTIKTWNELPKKMVHAKSIDSFKNELDEAWKDLPITFFEQERFIEA